MNPAVVDITKHFGKQNREVMGRASATGSILIKTTLYEVTAEALECTQTSSSQIKYRQWSLADKMMFRLSKFSESVEFSNTTLPCG